MAVLEWLAWCAALAWAVLTSLHVRKAMARDQMPPSPPRLMFHAGLWAILLSFLVLPASKLHILWLVPLLAVVRSMSVYLPRPCWVLYTPFYLLTLIFAKVLSAGAGSTRSYRTAEQASDGKEVVPAAPEEEKRNKQPADPSDK